MSVIQISAAAQCTSPPTHPTEVHNNFKPLNVKTFKNFTLINKVPTWQTMAQMFKNFSKNSVFSGQIFFCNITVIIKNAKEQE